MKPSPLCIKKLFKAVVEPIHYDNDNRYMTDRTSRYTFIQDMTQLGRLIDTMLIKYLRGCHQISIRVSGILWI